VTNNPDTAVSSPLGKMPVRLDEKLQPGDTAVAAEFQYMELRSPPAADPANAVPRKRADCSRTPKPAGLCLRDAGHFAERDGRRAEQDRSVYQFAHAVLREVVRKQRLDCRLP
jgi:hypothetical protein